ncbi:unnamed protein product, partial [Effrenium voratum]
RPAFRNPAPRGRQTRQERGFAAARTEAAKGALLALCGAFASRCRQGWQKPRITRIRRFNVNATGLPRKILLRPQTRIAHAERPLEVEGLQLCSGMSELVDCYDAFTLDQYGVLSDGREAFDGAAHCIAQMKAAGKPCVILSNYAGRAERQMERLPSMGLEPDGLAVVTAGELAHNYLAKQGANGKLGSRVLWIAWSERERGLGDFFEDLPGFSLASSVDSADFILVSGVESRFAGTEAEEACAYEETGEQRVYRPLFRAAIQRMLPMVCANPDCRVLRSDGRQSFMGGALAEYYERLGGQVMYFGKPHSSAFEEARRLLCRAAAQDEEEALELELDEGFRICHVGDSLQYDVQGAMSVGFDAAFVAQTGIHSSDLQGEWADMSKDRIRDLCISHKVPVPQAALPRFAW